MIYQSTERSKLTHCTRSIQCSKRTIKSHFTTYTKTHGNSKTKAASRTAYTRKNHPLPPSQNKTLITSSPFHARLKSRPCSAWRKNCLIILIIFAIKLA